MQNNKPLLVAIGGMFLLTILFLAFLYTEKFKEEPSFSLSISIERDYSPDEAVVYLSLSENNSTPGGALKAVLSYIKSLPFNVTTTQLSVYPVYNYVEVCSTQQPDVCNMESRIKTYMATWKGKLTVQHEKLSQILSLIPDKISVERVEFRLSEAKKEEVENILLKEAVDKAKAKAKELGFNTLWHLSYSFSTSQPIPIYLYTAKISNESGITGEVWVRLTLNAEFKR